MDDLRQIEDSLADIFRIILNDPNLRLSNELTAADVDGWDSLTHVMIISMIETRFGIQFTLKDLLCMESIGDIADTIRAKDASLP
jgi:acyl carrier protein